MDALERILVVVYTHRGENIRPISARKARRGEMVYYLMRKEYDFSQGKRGAVLPSPGKTRITIMLDDDILEFFRAQAEAAGMGYQTMINTALRAAVAQASGKEPDEPLTVAKLRQVLREELHAA